MRYNTEKNIIPALNIGPQHPPAGAIIKDIEQRKVEHWQFSCDSLADRIQVTGVANYVRAALNQVRDHL